jgi:chlorite dismutase
MKIFTLSKKLFVLLVLLTVTAAGTFGQILSEDFATLISGNNTSTGGSATAWAGNTNIITVLNAYEAGGVVKLGKSGAIGSITTKSLDLSANGGAFKVAFDVKGWTTVEGDIKVSIVGGASQTVTYTAVMATSSFESKEITFTSGGTSATQIIFETTAKRAFLDNIVITSTAIQGAALSVNSSLAFSSIKSNTVATQNLTIKGTNLTGNLTLSALSAPFGCNVSTITQADAMSANGFVVPITFSPTAKGGYTQNLTISGGGLTSDVTVTITASAYDVVPIANVTLLRNQWTGSEDIYTHYQLTGESLLTFVNGKNLYIQNSQSGLLVYDKNNLLTPYDAHVGDMVSDLTGTLAFYYGMLEFVITDASLTIASSGNRVDAIDVSAADFVSNFSTYEGRVIRINNVAFTSADGTTAFKATAESLDASSNGQSFVVRTIAASNYASTVIPSTCQLTGLAIIYANGNTTSYQVTPRSLDDLSTQATSIDQASTKNGVSVQNGILIIEGHSGENVAIYDITGRQVVSRQLDDTHSQISLTRGIYVIKLPSFTTKVVL